MGKLRVAIQGCCHGELDKIFQELEQLHKRNPIDLLLILGDFQSLRSENDFKSISIPPKYQKLGDFQNYYKDSNLKPCVPTIFIGGNHESMRHLMLLPFGGYVSNDIYFMGYSNMIWFKGLRIGGLSGIYKHWDLNKNRPGYKFLEEGNNWEKNVRSLYHVRKTDLLPLYMTACTRNEYNEKNGVNIMMSHDWPNGIVYHGNYKELLKVKPFFKRDVLYNQSLGSELNWELLNLFKPEWWVSAHLHVRYTAEFTHEDKKRKMEDIKTTNQDEISLDLDDLDSSSTEEEEKTTPVKTTHFLALDKCLPRRKHLEIIEIEGNENHFSSTSNDMYYDPEFINNLSYIEKNKEHSKIKNTPLNKIDINELISDNKIMQLDEIDWNKYKIPNYETDVQKLETEQTNSFIEQFLK
ncbi:hypothetical protein TPHA_0B02520 [Tetrapisispora phaffii CBS 4417]|uniref:Lariat debranching enzyme C-terminal domain-containing protein n=1 Tax=Tetrapisispora phaffii (strain ATCC 24235 / CBS 4417 / NBRC 1672 / NRRL Y-8282 / UCD 70-5) TaxID=1071381 RepID=G8BPJ4_TETPH|nr:hypothetical protein TPHA_0B02520 [Tetrapisispora phaffii CBS 4417]CCE61925.1 hypothetical protein TPHA_0B02520 [Tetrapisispora phaffii CBS 4417]